MGKKVKSTLKLGSGSAWAGFIRLCIGFVLLSLATGCGDQAASPIQLSEGNPFPSLTLDRLAGGATTTQDYKGKLLILNIWATWCPPCRKEMPSLQELSKILDPQHFAVVGLSADGEAQLVSEFIRRNGITFENFIDLNGKRAKQLNVKAYPETFLIAPDGTLVRRIMGEQDWSSPAMIKVLEDAYKGRRSSAGGWAYGGG